MRFLDKSEHDLFILALVLIVVVYFVGVNTEAGTFFSGLNNLGKTFTGRDDKGKFAAYPATGGAGDIGDGGAIYVGGVGDAGTDIGYVGDAGMLDMGTGDELGDAGLDIGAAQYDIATNQQYAYPPSWLVTAA